MHRKSLKDLKNFSNKKVLLTGGLGFLGYQVLHQLLKKNNHISLLVRKKSKNLNKLNFLKKKNNLKIIYCDNFFLSKKKFLKRITKNIDLVIHCAWNVEGNFMNSDKHLECLIGTLEFAKACIENRIQKFVGIGSCTEYDPKNGYLSVRTKLNPSTNYSATKIATYIALKRLFESSEIDFLWCRVFYLYGEGESENRLIPYVIKMINQNKNVELTSGKQVRDYIDVRKAGKKIVKYSYSNKKNAVNICSGKGVTIKKIVTSIANKLNKKHLLKFGVRKENPFDPPKVIGIK